MLEPWKALFNISFNSEKSLVEQITAHIRKEIIKGRLEPGMTLPGSRILAQDIGVNRKTIVFAYESLIAEGWLETRYKSGTFVAANLPVSTEEKTITTAIANFRFTEFSANLTNDYILNSAAVTFSSGTPDTRLAPVKEISRAYRRIFQQKGAWKILGYNNGKGDLKLREMISLMLSRDRGLFVEKEELCITRGSQMGLYLAINVLVKPGDIAVMELPGYQATYKLFKNAGARLMPVNVDKDGFDVDQLEAICIKNPVKVVYITPHHQFPTTVTMKAARRLKLLELSIRFGFAIIEDDYDHEYHYGAGNNLALASHELAVNVIYLSSLSKLIAPAIRIGYITGSAAFMKSLVNLRIHIDRQGDMIMERAIADLIEDGTLRRHNKRVISIYQQKRDLVEALLIEHFDQNEIEFEKPEGGLAYWIKLKKKMDLNQFMKDLGEHGVKITPPHSYFWEGTVYPILRLDFGSLNEKELETGITRIAEVYHNI